MNIEDVRTYCLSLPGATEDMPYGPDWVVFRIGGKIFLHIWLEAPEPTIAIKLPPDDGMFLRTRYAGAVTEAYHLNKSHWNDVRLRQLSSAQVTQWISQSYALVLSKLPRAQRALWTAPSC